MEITRYKGYDSYTYEFKEQDKTLIISFGGNLDLYWTLRLNKEYETYEETQEEIYDIFTITKENYEIYSLFETLIKDVKDANVYTPNKICEINENNEVEFYPPSYEEIKRTAQRNEELKQEYEGLKQKYEEARYTFNLKEVQENISCVWENDDKNSGKLHPCEKPLDILEKIIKTSSNENDVVLDCFMGSGSTGVACLNTNRKFIGIELDNNFFGIAERRIKGTKND
jgi:DNA modification methylase